MQSISLFADKYNLTKLITKKKYIAPRVGTTLELVKTNGEICVRYAAFPTAVSATISGRDIVADIVFIYTSPESHLSKGAQITTDRLNFFPNGGSASRLSFRRDDFLQSLDRNNSTSHFAPGSLFLLLFFLSLPPPSIPFSTCYPHWGCAPFSGFSFPSFDTMSFEFSPAGKEGTQKASVI